MPTVIDSLLIELGLDASKFDKAQKKAVEGLHDIEKQSEKTRKEKEQGTKQELAGLNKVGEAVFKVAAAYAAVKTVANFAASNVKSNAQIGRTATLLNISAKELTIWGAVVGETQATMEGFAQAFAGIQQGIATNDMGVLTELGALGVDASKGVVTVKALADAFKKLVEVRGISFARDSASKLGIDENLFLSLIKGGAALENLYEKYEGINSVTDKTIQQSKELERRWSELEKRGKSVGDSIFRFFVPALETTLGMLNEVLALKDRALSPATEENGITYDAMGNAIWVQTGQPPSAPSSGANGAKGEVPRNLRNNNPGNIEYGDFAKRNGATGSDGRFAIFPNMEAGVAAHRALLDSYAAKGFNTIASIIGRWSPAGENGAANTEAYISEMEKKTGLDRNKQLTTFQRGRLLRQAQQDHEGMMGAQARTPRATAANVSTAETHIQNLTVNTQVTNADQFAQEIPKRLQNVAILNAGTGGAQ